MDIKLNSHAEFSMLIFYMATFISLHQDVLSMD